MFVEVLPQVAETFKAPAKFTVPKHDRKATGRVGDLWKWNQNC